MRTGCRRARRLYDAFQIQGDVFVHQNVPEAGQGVELREGGVVDQVQAAKVADGLGVVVEREAPARRELAGDVD